MRNLSLLSVFALFGLVAQAQTGSTTRSAEPAIPYGNNAAAGHYLATRGFRLYYESYGAGDPVLLFHGNGGSLSNMANQIAFFAKHYRVIAVDTRAHGRSKDPSDSLSFEQIVDDFNALLDSLHLDSCYVIGWSDGGIDALLLAIRHPDKVRKMAFTGANLWPDSSAFDPFIYRVLQEQHAKNAHEPRTAANRNGRKIFDLDYYQPHITLDQLHHISCPTLVIGGDHDVIAVEHTVLIAKNIPHSDLWIVPNSGHSVPIFKKDQFNATVYAFFTQPFREIKGAATFQ